MNMLPTRRRSRLQHPLTLLLPLLFIVLSASAGVADSPGSTAAEFLKIGVGARATSMGGAYTALADDVFSLHWNPAGLARLKTHQAAFQVNSYIEDIDQHFLGVAAKYKNVGTFGVGLNLFSSGSIPRTTVSANGTVNSLGSFEAKDMAFSFGGARHITPWMTAGATVKWIRSSIAEYDADAYAADFGVQLIPVSFLSVGIAIQNVGTRMKFMTEADPLPLLYRLGAAGYFLKDDALVVSMDVTQASSDILTFGIGCEYTLMRLCSFRVGYTSANGDVDRGLTGGFGVRFKNGWKLEYAFIPFGILGDAHRYSLTVPF